MRHLIRVIDATAIKSPVLNGSAVHAAVLADSGVILVPADLGGRAALCLENSADLPATQHLASEMGLATEQRQFVEEVRDKHVTNIEVGWRPESVGVVGIGNDVPLVRSIIRTLAVSVGYAEQQAASETAIP